MMASVVSRKHLGADFQTPHGNTALNYEKGWSQNQWAWSLHQGVWHRFYPGFLIPKLGNYTPDQDLTVWISVSADDINMLMIPFNLQVPQNYGTNICYYGDCYHANACR